MARSVFHSAFPAKQGSSPPETPETKCLLQSLNMAAHPEGRYFVETGRDPLLIPSPFPSTPASSADFPERLSFKPNARNASTSIYYLLTLASPQGHFHQNRGRTVHTLHPGRGRYVILHADLPGCPVETFVVGQDVTRGERLQWIVEGGRFKASFLLLDRDLETSGGGGAVDL